MSSTPIVGNVTSVTTSFSTTPITAQIETTSQAVLNEYTNDTNVLVALYNASATDVQNGSISFSYTDPTTGTQTTITLDSQTDLLAAVQAALYGGSITSTSGQSVTLQGLQNLAENGIVSLNAAGVSQQYYMSYEMVTAYSQLFSSLEGAGFSTTSSAADQINELSSWKNLTSFGLSSIMSAVSSAVADSTTLQAMVDIDYIETGNNLITNELDNLNSAITVNQNILNLLTQIQNLHNQVTAINKTLSAKFSYFYHSYTGSTSSKALDTSYVGSYRIQTSTLFGKPVVPVVNANPTVNGSFQPLDLYDSSGNITAVVTSTDANNLRTQYVQLEGQLSQAIAQLQKAGGSSTLITSLQQIQSDMMGGNSSTAVTTTLQLDQNITNWLEDNMGNPSATTSGNYQTDITNSINDASQINQTQQNTLQQYTFVFQEFYESASSIMSQLNQLLNDVEQNISKG